LRADLAIFPLAPDQIIAQMWSKWSSTGNTNPRKMTDLKLMGKICEHEDTEAQNSRPVSSSNSS